MSKTDHDCLAASGGQDMIPCSYPRCTCGPSSMRCQPSQAPQDPQDPQPRRLLSTLTSAERKQYPMASGLLDYFPDALALVSHISYLGNQKHNPGQELHWSRGKSNDHADCQIRHMIERDTVDTEGVEHMAQKAWRALAELQEHLEKTHGLSLPRGAR